MTAAPPQLPAGAEAALERLQHLTRRFSAALPAQAPADPAAERTPAPSPAAPRPERVSEPRPLPLPPAPTPVPAAEERPRVEIGSIEVFVTQPVAPPPVPAPVAPFRPDPPAASSERLSRPLRAYGFGQG